MSIAEADTRPAPTAPPGGWQTLPARLLELAAERPDDVAYRRKRLGRWEETTFSAYAGLATRAGLGLAELGVGAGDRVAIHSENRPEWLIADLGAQGIGAQTVGIYPTSPAAEVEYLVGHSETSVLICEDEEQLDKAIEVRERLPDLRRIVVIDPRGVRRLDDPMVVTWDEMLELGATRDPGEWRERVAALDPESPAIVVYTSGTTGPPKGALITHANIRVAATAATEAYGADPDDEVLSYLPLSHIAERLVSLIDALAVGYVVNFGEGAETFAEDLRDIQPIFFVGVPRVWEKMVAGVEIRMSDASRLKRVVWRRAIARGSVLAKRRLAGSFGRRDALEYRLWWLLCFRALRAKLGLSRVRIALSGAAPVSPELLETLMAIGIPVREVYGQTENTAMGTYTPADGIRLGAVGVPLPGVEIRIAEDGEILTRSGGNFAGYLKNPEATAEVLDEDGWLHTGDVGEFDEDGYLRITDRKKDIIITAGGKNVSPSEIENALKISPYVREAIVVGDQRKYLSALIGIEGETVGDWATRRRIPFTTYADLSRNEHVHELIEGVVEETNSSLARVEQVKRFALIPIELDHEDGQLTATQKVKRAAISEQFKDLIEDLYR